MTKNEFKGFSSAAQHDMVLEALVRVTKNLEIMEEVSGKPFVGTVKQCRNDVKLLTILAEAFSKNELVWAKKSKSTRDDGKTHHDAVLSRGAVYNTGIGQMVYEELSKDNIRKPLPESMRRGNTKPVVEIVDVGKHTTLGEYAKEIIKESRGKYYGKEEK